MKYNAFRFSDAEHRTTGKGPCSDPFHPGHQPRPVYHMRESADRRHGYPGLPGSLAIYAVKKRVSTEEALKRPDQAKIRKLAAKGVPFSEAYSAAKKDLPLARVLDTALPNSVHRFLNKAKEQEKLLVQWRKWMEPVDGGVEVVENVLAEAGIAWGRMKDIELVQEGEKAAIIRAWTDPDGLGLGGWSRSHDWDEELAEAVIRVLEPANGEKGRTRAGRLPGVKELVSEPERSPCPVCGEAKSMVGPLTDEYPTVGPYLSEITGQLYYVWLCPGEREDNHERTKRPDSKPKRHSHVHRRVGRVHMGMAAD